MASIFARAANTILKPVGLTLCRSSTVNNSVPKAKHVQTVNDVEALLRRTMFPAIPQLPSRLDLLAQLIGTNLVEAMFLLNELHHALKVEGDFCELGIAQGTTSALMANEIRDTSRKLWLFDSFEGLPRPTEKDKLIDDIFNLGSIEKYQGTMAVGQDSVLSRLRAIQFPLERVNVVPGFIEETSKLASLPGRVAFAYIDFDFYQPILIGLRLLRERLPVGGRVMVDDYGWFSSGAQTAVDEFVKEAGGEFTMRLPPEGSGHFAMLEKVG